MKPAVCLARTGLFLLSLIAISPLGNTAELVDPKSQFQGVAPASDEGQNAIKGFVVPKGLEVELVAAEPLLANPVAFSIDEQGRFYVMETFRLHNGVLDIRGRRGWPKERYREGMSEARTVHLADEVLDVDLAPRNVDDRVAYLKNFFGENVTTLSQAADRVRMIWDESGDGNLDTSKVFFEAHSRPEDGLGSGVLAKDGNVWITDIPYLWKTQDTNGDGRADQQRPLHHGFGVRTGFLGHDSHGLEFGPDGRLYFTIGDRGASVMLSGGRSIDMPDTGAVFRCYPDGSGLELYAFGLRNPQELTFDQHGNLFTGDNNSDGGDEARWVHLVEGGDSGWRIGYQFFEGSTAIYHNMARGPWNAEKIWHTQNADQPAHVIPPVAILGNGPSGVSFYPGTGLSEMWNGQFFLVDFKGQASVSGVHTFDLMPAGAGFKMGYEEHFIWNVLATDIEFGVDGGVYISDWTHGWGLTGKGRIYRVFDPALEGDSRIEQTAEILGAGMANRSSRELGRLLGHRDYRIRLDAQFELVRRGEKGIRYLRSAARQTNVHLSRLHGVWGLGQIADQFKGQVIEFDARDEVISTLIELLSDKEPRIREQSAKVLGDARANEAFDSLIELTSDEDSKVRFHAVMALGKLNQPNAIPAILKMVRENNDEDPLLRHAGSMALANLQDIVALRAAANDTSAAVRMASLIALRRLQRDDVELFLEDKEPRIVREAARAINDRPIDGATMKLAALEPFDWSDAVVVSRIINANLRSGNTAHAKRLTAIGANTTLPVPARRDALLAVADWAQPSGRDRVTGVWRPLIASTRDSEIPTSALKPHVSSLLDDKESDIQLAVIKAIVTYEIASASDPLLGVVVNDFNSESVRIAALNALETFMAEELDEALKIASASGLEKLAGAASSIRARSGSGDVLADIRNQIISGSVSAKQLAIDSLRELKSVESDTYIAELLDQLDAGSLSEAIALDVIELANSRSNERLQAAAEAILAADISDAGRYRFAKIGGNPEIGLKIFKEREDVACLRCHRVEGVGGEVGPVLDGLASRVSEQHILEAIVLPNKVIAEGFENVMIETKDGVWYAGMVKSEDDTTVQLESLEDGPMTIQVADVKTRQRTASGMPPGMEIILKQKELRDLIAYLKTLK